MIPDELRRRLKDQAERNPLVNRSSSSRGAVLEALSELQIEEDEEIAQFYLAYRMDAITGVRGFRQLLDVCEPVKHVLRSTHFARRQFGLSDAYVCLDTAEGEGFIVYSRTTLAVYEGGFPEVHDLNQGSCPPTWNTFFGLMLDYVMPGFIPETGQASDEWR